MKGGVGVALKYVYFVSTRVRVADGVRHPPNVCSAVALDWLVSPIVAIVITTVTLVITM